ncbi:MAG: hypothetical protein WC794_00185 [Candidatus Doudnabacteria bacterium]|jgi:DNA-directed RNA polymerase specialized sigma subunit
MWGSESGKIGQDEQDEIFGKTANPDAKTINQPVVDKPEISEHEARILKMAEKSEQVSNRMASNKKRRKVYDKSFDELFGEMILDPNRNPEEQVYLKELHQVLKDAWNDKTLLQPHFKEVLYLHFFQGKNLDEIANICQLNSFQVTHYLEAVLGKLRHSKYFEQLYFNNKQGKGNFEIK